MVKRKHRHNSRAARRARLNQGALDAYYEERRFPTSGVKPPKNFGDYKKRFLSKKFSTGKTSAFRNADRNMRPGGGGRSAGARKAWITRKKKYGASGRGKRGSRKRR
jgi:hypothetical protein